MHQSKGSSFSRFHLKLALIWLPLCSLALAQSNSVSKITFFASSTQSSNSGAATYPADTTFVPLHINVKNTLEAATEINGNTCKLISTGTYKATTAPKYGKLSYFLANEKDPSPPCTNKVFPYNFASYTWTNTKSLAPQDFFHLHWFTPDGTSTYDRDWLAELIPETETTVFKFWAVLKNAPTVGAWQQTIKLTTIDYKGVTIREKDPGGEKEVCNGNKCTPDTCYWPDSKRKAEIHISPAGDWVVEKGNIWGEDYVGWLPAAVNYYRNAGRAPCGTVYPQQMQIRFATGDPKFYDYGGLNTLGGWFDMTTVTSIRAGKSKAETWK